MSELPREARELLELARDGHELPAPDARARVRRGVTAAVAIGAGAAISGKAIAAGSKAGLFASTGAKLATIGSAIVLAGAAVVSVPLLRHEETDKPAAAAPKRAKKVVVAAPAPAPVEVVEPVIAEPAVVAEDRAARSTRAARREPAKSPPSDALRAEMTLLRTASDALSAGQLELALTRLGEHEQRFARGQLGEEREGLRVIARCLGAERGASAAARRYLRRHPESVLAVRAISACKLESAK